MIDWSNVKRIHLIGVAGTGMGSFAGMLKAAGYEVTGSDENVYPPMSTQLERWGIEVLTPYAAANLGRARPDLVVVGNVVRAVNPEAAEDLLRRASAFPNQVVGVYLVESAIDDRGRAAPDHFREVFRTRGPSNYPQHGRQAERSDV